MDKFMPLPENLKNALLEIVFKYDLNEIFQPTQEEENIIEQLKSAGYLLNFKPDILGNYTAKYHYEDEHYEFLEQEYNKQKSNNTQIFINNGRQMDVAFDNATVNVTQNSGISPQKLVPYIDKIMQAIQEEIAHEDKETATDSVNIIREELESGNPNEKNIKKHFKLLSKISNGVNFASACCTLITFVDNVYPFLHNLSALF